MRDEESAFQAALDANPLDDAVRLVYADWLEDRDDLARAASVRDRCARLGRIREKFANLKAKDQGLKVWAARSHRYHLEPPLPMAMLRELEKRYGIHFPDDYRDFVTRFAEAGAGPPHKDNRGQWQTMLRQAPRLATGLAKGYQARMALVPGFRRAKGPRCPLSRWCKRVIALFADGSDLLARWRCGTMSQEQASMKQGADDGPGDIHHNNPGSPEPETVQAVHGGSGGRGTVRS